MSASDSTDTAPAATVTTQPQPSTATIAQDVPTLILPASPSSTAVAAAAPAADKSDGDGEASMINVLLNADNYPWSFVVNNSDATSQLFVLFPQMLATPLNISLSNVSTYALQAYAPAAYNGDSTKLLTKWLGYIPSDLVNDLAQYIKTPSSPLYTQGGIPGQLAMQIDASYPLVGSSTDSSAANSGKSVASAADTKRRNTIIGVCVGVGGAMWIGLMFWIYRRVKRSNEEAVHKRMSDPPNQDPFADPYRQSVVSSIAASEVDARPSSFYANPEDHEQEMRERRHQTWQDISLFNNTPHVAQQSSPTGLSSIGSSWFRSSGSHSQPRSGAVRDGPARNANVTENPFADIVHRSYLESGPNHNGAYRRSHVPFHRPINKRMIGNPTLQANSLEFTEQH